MKHCKVRQRVKLTNTLQGDTLQAALSFTHGDTNGSSMRISNCVWRIKKRVTSDTTDNHITQQGTLQKLLKLLKTCCKASCRHLPRARMSVMYT